MIVTGLHNFIRDYSLYKKRKGALLVNQSSVTGDLTYGWDALIAAGFNVTKIFSPEHGLFGVEQDQVASESTVVDGIPVTSLYGSRYSDCILKTEDLDGVDYLLFDIQDTGSRYYTFLQTLYLAMPAIAGRGIELVVCDRPNPLGGIAVEGPGIDPAYTSFVGLFSIPVRHGLTAGEMAHLMKDEQRLDLKLTVVAMSGWRRSLFFNETGLFWIPPSPNMPLSATALVYPGACLLEGTNFSEGRGTTRPFETCGSPTLDAVRVSRNLQGKIPGAALRPLEFRPQFQKHRGELCRGISVHVIDRGTFRPFRCFAVIVAEFFRNDPQARFFQGTYEFVNDRYAFDLLSGSSLLRQIIAAGDDVRDLFPSWEIYEEEFKNVREKYIRYGDR